jgi:hypothetical protein
MAVAAKVRTVSPKREEYLSSRPRRKRRPESQERQSADWRFQKEPKRRPSLRRRDRNRKADPSHGRRRRGRFGVTAHVGSAERGETVSHPHTARVGHPKRQSRQSGDWRSQATSFRVRAAPWRRRPRRLLPPRECRQRRRCGRLRRGAAGGRPAWSGRPREFPPSARESLCRGR